MSDVGVRHAVAFPNNLNIHHFVDLSPSVTSVTREIRISVVAIVVGVAAVSIIKTVLSSKNSSRAERNT